MDPSDEARPATAGARGVARRVPASVWEAEGAAAAILRRAREEAEALVAAAAEEAARVRAGARVEVDAARVAAAGEGRACGLADGLAEGQAKGAAEVLRGAAERERLLAACAGDALDLAVEMAARVLEREVRSPGDAAGAARRALEACGGARPVLVRASPGEAEAVAAAVGAAAGRAVRVAADEALAPGEVVVRAGASEVDATFRTQLARLRRAVEEAGG